MSKPIDKMLKNELVSLVRRLLASNHRLDVQNTQLRADNERMRDELHVRRSAAPSKRALMVQARDYAMKHHCQARLTQDGSGIEAYLDGAWTPVTL